jgi:hypothetical protein
MPLASAQTYSGFNRWVDNVKLFFSGDDGKVRLALEIREKEINSAIENTENGKDEKANKNLEKAWEKLQLVQEKVSIETADEVRESVDEVRDKIEEKKELKEDFKVYDLEEEKTGLTAEWVVEVNGKEGQTMTNEVVVNGSQGQRKNEIENRIDKIDSEISNWVVVTEVGRGNGSGGLVPVVKTEIAKGDNGLKPEVKTYVKGDGTLKNDPLPVPNLNKVNPDLYNPNARAPGDIIDDTYDDNIVNQGSCGDGVDCGDGSAEPGTKGIHEEPSPAIDSNEGDSGNVVATGAVIASENKAYLLGKLIKTILFGK